VVVFTMSAKAEDDPPEAPDPLEELEPPRLPADAAALAPVEEELDGEEPPALLDVEPAETESPG
jgi:hypothetical protein